MKVSDFYYELPEELIAKHPPRMRGAAKLLVLDKETGTVADRKYSILATI